MLLVVLLIPATHPARAAAAPPAGPPPGFVELVTVAPRIAIEMRYAGSQNFVGRPIRGYAAPRCWLSRPAALALARVGRSLARQGLGLMVYDCYRPQRAVADFVAWAASADTSTQARHYPAVPKSELFSRGYIAARSGHSRGSTVDLTLVPLVRGTRVWAREPDDCRFGAKDSRRGRSSLAGPSPSREVRNPSEGSEVDSSGSENLDIDMGTSFDCFDERAHAEYSGLTPAVRRNRRVLRQAMRRGGFSPYAKEWWHFTLTREPFPNRYFDFEIR